MPKLNAATRKNYRRGHEYGRRVTVASKHSHQVYWTWLGGGLFLLGLRILEHHQMGSNDENGGVVIRSVLCGPDTIPLQNTD